MIETIGVCPVCEMPFRKGERVLLYHHAQMVRPKKGEMKVCEGHIAHMVCLARDLQIGIATLDSIGPS